jgi:conjugal transfer pilus assembly protein TraU
MTQKWDCTKRLALSVVALAFIVTAHVAQAAEGLCQGRFPNLFTDICWSCLLPVSFGPWRVATFNQEDTDTQPPLPVCACPGVPPKVGVTVGFWEPARVVETVRRPWCLHFLDGTEVDPGYRAPPGSTRSEHNHNKEKRRHFWQVHYYVFPPLAMMQVINDFHCLENADFDLVYVTEVDPLWNDDEWTAILNPEVILFANPVAIAACAVDCVTATAGNFGIASMFWCTGCQGSMFPLTGNVTDQSGIVNATTHVASKFLYKMHRQYAAWNYAGSSALCGPTMMPVMDKTIYKQTMLYPVPQTKKITTTTGSNSNGRCCQPIGRTTILWGAGKTFPLPNGQDAVYLYFRKRNCCAN